MHQSTVAGLPVLAEKDAHERQTTADPIRQRKSAALLIFEVEQQWRQSVRINAEMKKYPLPALDLFHAFEAVGHPQEPGELSGFGCGGDAFRPVGPDWADAGPL